MCERQFSGNMELFIMLVVVVAQCCGARVSSVRHYRCVSAIPCKQLRERRPAFVLLITSSDRVVLVDEVCLPSLSLSTT